MAYRVSVAYDITEQEVCAVKLGSHVSAVTHRYDDYDYGEVNQLLERSLKVYIKTVTCYPERTTKRMYDSYWRQFTHSEKVSVITADLRDMFNMTASNQEPGWAYCFSCFLNLRIVAVH